jgi:hypothetical protein
MNTHVSTGRRLSTAEWLALLPGVIALMLLAQAGGLSAQNNDNGGVLPGSFGSEASNGQASDAVLAVEGHVEGTTVDEVHALIEVTAPGLVAVGVASGVAEEDAEFISTSSLLAEQAPGGELLIQGSGLLNTEIGLGLQMHAAGSAVARAALLVADDGTTPMSELLEGAAAPFAIVPMGDLPELDLVSFEHLLAKHAKLAPAFRVSVVFVSVDAWGDVHKAAVSGFTGGGLLEIAYQ